MGNTVKTFEGSITYIRPSQYDNGTVILVLTNFDIYLKKLYLWRENPKYAEIMNKIEVNKAYNFTIENGWQTNELLDVGDPNVYQKTIKINGFIDLAKEYPDLKGWSDVVYDGSVSIKLIIKDASVFEKGEKYIIRCELYGMHNLYQITHYKKQQKIEK